MGEEPRGVMGDLAEFASGAFELERIIVYGLLVLMGSMLWMTFYIVRHLVTVDPSEGIKLAQSAMTYFNNIGFTILGALTSALRPKQRAAAE